MNALIVAHTRSRVIGANGRIPWDIPGEKTRFRELTTDNVVIMGRRTYEEIGKPLPNRVTIVVSSTSDFRSENCYMASSLKAALSMFPEKDKFIAGGQQLYQEGIRVVDKMFITLVDCDIQGDTFFPEFPEKDFVLTEEIHYPNNEIPYTYKTYRRRGKP